MVSCEAARMPSQDADVVNGRKKREKGRERDIRM